MKKEPGDFLGLLMLDTNFPRFVGDIGNPASYTFPLRSRIVRGASPARIIRENPKAFLEPFVEAARQLESEGARLITTSCGFLTPFQAEIQQAVSVPVLASSLFLHPHLASLLPAGKKAGILTIAASSLSPNHLAAAGIPADTPIGTTEGGGEFTAAILENRDKLDFGLAQKDNVAAAIRLKSEYPDLGAILLECTNMPPYADSIRAATGLPVFSILDGLNALWSGNLSDITLQQGAESGSQNTA